MVALQRYDDLFSQLIFDRSFRDRVRAGDWSLLGDAADAFVDIDWVKLEKLSTGIRDNLLRGALGMPGIGAAFAGAIAALGGGPEAVAERFLAAYPAAAGIDGTGRQAGVSALERFHGWAEGQLAGRPAELAHAQHELAAALIPALARTPRPGFLVEWPLARHAARGWCCVLDAARPLRDAEDRPDQPVAYVGFDGRYAAGPLALPAAAVVLEAAEQPPAWAMEQLACIDPAALEAARLALAAGELPA